MQNPGAQKLLGTNLRAARKVAGVTQERLALEAGLHRAYVGAVERGEVNVSLGNIVQLARTLGIDATTLVAGTERSAPEN